MYNWSKYKEQMIVVWAGLTLTCTIRSCNIQGTYGRWDRKTVKTRGQWLLYWHPWTVKILIALIATEKGKCKFMCQHAWQTSHKALSLDEEL